MKRNLLERGVPVDKINIEARKEKKSVPPITKMHYYFTRKPLITARMAVAGAVLDEDVITNISTFNRLMGIDPKFKKRAYDNLQLSLLKHIKNQHPEGCEILDPFAGSGMIPFEAIRLGLNVTAIDYNPVAHLIMKGTLEYPIKYGLDRDSSSGLNKLYIDVKRYSENIYTELERKFSDYYPEYNGVKTKGYVWAWAVECPICGQISPLVNSWTLDSNKGIYLDYNIIDNKIQYKISKENRKQQGNTSRGSATCLFCSGKIKNEDIVNDILKYKREIPLAKYLDNNEFVIPDDEDFFAIEKSKKYLKDNYKKLTKFIPIESMPDDKRSVIAKKYLTSWSNIYNPRQLMIFAEFAYKAREIVEEIMDTDMEYAKAVGIYLSMMLTNHVRFNSRVTQWVAAGPKLGNIYSSRGIGMMWTHGEPNSFAKFSGSLGAAIKNVLDGLNYAISTLNSNFNLNSNPKITLYRDSILSWDNGKKYKYIITDPPYYDDVPYPELMHILQVWHNKILGDIIDVPSTMYSSEELSVNENRDEKVFESRMMVALRRIYHLLEDEGSLVLFYAHKSPEGWKYLVEALRKTGFKVTSTITLMTENKESVVARGKSSVFHSLLITARKRTDNKTISVMDLEVEIRKKMHDRYNELENVYGKDRMNLMVAASGVVIESITSYSNVTSFTKNTADYALEIGQKYLIELFAKNALNIGQVDPKTMVYIWFRYSLRDDIDYSEFNQTLKALGISDTTVNDIIDKSRKSKLRLLDYMERSSLEIDGMEPLIAQTVIDATHISLRAYARGGISTAQQTIQNSPFGTQTILNTIEALAKITGTKTNYQEGETCEKFLTDWNARHGKPTKLEHFNEEK